MRRLFRLASLFVAMTMLSCMYDDTALLNDLNALNEKVENLENRVDEQQILLNALANQLTIVSIATTTDGYIITFSDNSTLTIHHGKDGENGVDGTNGAIVDVEWDDDSATFTLADGTTIVVPLEDVEENLPEIPETPVVGIEAVDLGLSVKWATCNVGANSPEEFGDYFAWGEVSPKESYTEDNCTTYGVSMTDISGNPQYDAATANWGEDWRMPTVTEIEELYNNCIWKWMTLNGINGMCVTGPNGNSIFLPAAAYRYEMSHGVVGEWGDYWSSTPNGDECYYAHRLVFSSEAYIDWHWLDRSYGRSVRPVSE